MAAFFSEAPQMFPPAGPLAVLIEAEILNLQDSPAGGYIGSENNLNHEIPPYGSRDVTPTWSQSNLLSPVLPGDVVSRRRRVQFDSR